MLQGTCELTDPPAITSAIIPAPSVSPGSSVCIWATMKQLVRHCILSLLHPSLDPTAVNLLASADPVSAIEQAVAMALCWHRLSLSMGHCMLQLSFPSSTAITPGTAYANCVP